VNNFAGTAFFFVSNFFFSRISSIMEEATRPPVMSEPRLSLPSQGDEFEQGDSRRDVA
jgi:hypothetical protein